jgi:Tfp pilus assembly protein PilO
MRDLLTQLRQQRLRKGHLRSKLDAAQVQVDGLLAYRGNAATLRRRLDFIPSSKLDHMMEVTMLVDKVYDSTAATWLANQCEVPPVQLHPQELALSSIPHAICAVGRVLWFACLT